MNTEFSTQLSGVEDKIAEQEVVLSKIVHRLQYVGRENQVLPIMHDLLAICTSICDKINTEASRVGIIKRKLILPAATHFPTI